MRMNVRTRFSSLSSYPTKDWMRKTINVLSIMIPMTKNLTILLVLGLMMGHISCDDTRVMKYPKKLSSDLSSSSLRVSKGKDTPVVNIAKLNNVENESIRTTKHIKNNSYVSSTDTNHDATSRHKHDERLQHQPRKEYRLNNNISPMKGDTTYSIQVRNSQILSSTWMNNDQKMHIIPRHLKKKSMKKGKGKDEKKLKEKDKDKKEDKEVWVESVSPSPSFSPPPSPSPTGSKESLIDKLDEFDDKPIKRKPTSPSTTSPTASPTKMKKVIQLSPFSIELDQKVPELQIRMSLVLYLTNTMMLNEETNESVELFGTPESVTSNQFQYNGTLTFDECDACGTTADNAKSSNGVRNILSTSTDNDPSVYLMKQMLALQDTTSLNNAINQNLNGLNVTTNNNTNPIQIVHVDIFVTSDNSTTSTNDEEEQDNNDTKQNTTTSGNGNKIGTGVTSTNDPSSQSNSNMSLGATPFTQTNDNNETSSDSFFHTVHHAFSNFDATSSTESLFILIGTSIGLLCILIIIIALVVYFCLYRPRKRKTQKEIIDQLEYDYDNQVYMFKEKQKIENDNADEVVETRSIQQCALSPKSLLLCFAPNHDNSNHPCASSLSSLSHSRLNIEHNNNNNNQRRVWTEDNTNSVSNNNNNNNNRINDSNCQTSIDDDNSYWDDFSHNGSSIVSIT